MHTIQFTNTSVQLMILVKLELCNHCHNPVLENFQYSETLPCALLWLILIGMGLG